MSNALAIAAVTTMLDYLVTQALARNMNVNLESVTAKPLDKARESGDTTNQINIFLYQTLHSTAWRNQDIPSRVKFGETGRPPLALTLSYLITAYGKGNDDIEGQRLLGMAMQTLHDHTVIRPRDVDRAMGSANIARPKRELLASSDLKNQIERIKITPQKLSIEEVSTMWSAFQVPYRISAAYEASVVLIESNVSTKAPLPVLSRGFNNDGSLVQTGLIPPVPTLESLSWPSQPLGSQPSITLGEPLTLCGHHLKQGEKLTFLELTNSKLNDPIEQAVPLPTDKFTVNLANDISNDWVVGFYTVSLRYGEGGLAESSNQLAIAIAPQIILLLPTSRTVANKTLTLTCQPPVKEGQQVSLLLGSHTVPLDPEFQATIQSSPNPPSSNALSFNLSALDAGSYKARLRVDGIDSHLVTITAEGRLTYDPQYEFTIPK